MSNSPLQFAKQFAQLKSTLATAPPDGKLMAIVDFWPRLDTHRSDPAYRSYFDELTPLFLELITKSTLTDVTIDELKKLRDLLSRLEDSPDAQEAAKLLDRQLVRLLLYVGDIESALSVCYRLSGGETGRHKVAPYAWGDTDRHAARSNAEMGETSHASHSAGEVQMERPGPHSRRGGVCPRLEIDDDLTEFEVLTAVCEACSGVDDTVYHILEPLRVEWESLRESLSNDTACCLFVERSNAADLLRGRMRMLQGTVDLFGKNVTQDEVSFHSQVVGPRDPFIGAAYKALGAVKPFLARQGWKKGGRAAHAHFEIVDSDHTFTGDSIGLAFAAVAYAQLLKPEVLRLERFVSAEAAFTGCLDADGNLTPVNDETLPLKIRRAFFSPVRYVVLPEQNLASAASIVSDLRKTYPRRYLKLIAAERLEDVLEDRNVIRAEKVCLGEYVVKKAYKYSRATKVQVPLLLVMLYALICIMFPKAWIGFDDNPVYAIANPTTNSLEAYSRDSTLLWADPLSCPISKVTSDVIWSISFGQPYDFDGDGKNEVVFLPGIDNICDDRAFLRFYSHDGRLLWTRSAALLGRYPKDTAGVQYDAGFLRIVETSNGPVIVSMVFQDMPARTHIRSWNAEGDSLGWYIHWGHVGIQKMIDVDRDGQEEILFTGFSNKKDCVALLVLRPDSIRGFSPIEPGMENKYPWWIPGNQAAYILFPKSDVGSLPEELPFGYNIPGPNGIRLADDGQIQVYISESVNYDNLPELIYTIDHRMRVVKVAMNDCLVTHRRQLVAEGKLQPIEDAGAYFDSLRNAVTYWTDSGWVTEGQLRAIEGTR